ncbi:MAG TPA: hypothetical protein VHZ55_23830 [Bryobacteraceae bacterium]|jgi:hypothetical protein|nr:hypothetical protein [Bryobacteraceae bacterium]
MSRFYRELHDRELLLQAAAILQEVQDRKLLDVMLPPDARNENEDTGIFPRRLASVSVHKERLKLAVERQFFQTSKPSSNGNHK